MQQISGEGLQDHWSSGISLYLLNMKMDEVYTLHVDRYWSEVLCCTIRPYLGDLEVKVMDLEILFLKFMV